MMKEVCYILDWKNRNEIGEKCLACPASFLIIKDKGLDWNEETESFERFEWTILASERHLPEIEMLFAPYV